MQFSDGTSMCRANARGLFSKAVTDDTAKDLKTYTLQSIKKWWSCYLGLLSARPGYLKPTTMQQPAMKQTCSHDLQSLRFSVALSQ